MYAVLELSEKALDNCSVTACSLSTECALPLRTSNAFEYA